MTQANGKTLFSPSLTRRIIGFAVLVVGLTFWAVIWRSEAVLERAFLEQTKQQAQVFLLGLESEIQQLEQPLEPASLQQVVDYVGRREHLAMLNFSVYELYIFDREGHFLAHSRPGDHPAKRIDATLEGVLGSGMPYMGEEVEYAEDAASGRLIPKADIIIPLHVDGEVVAGIEVEINLEETVAMIKQFDDHYEGDLLLIVGVSSLLTLMLFWWGIHHLLIRPVQSLCRVTQGIGAGELGMRERRLGYDELGELGRSINEMADSIERLFSEQEEAYWQMLQSLAKALEARDRNTSSHSARVARYSVQIGRRLGLPDNELLLLKQGALMHDLGKIGIDDKILNKPEALTDAEFEEMQRHPELTASIMRPLKRFKQFADIAAWHHERWDGNGYPDGLKGEEIPLLARIVAIADTWDAMTGDRIYRKGMEKERAITIFERERDDGQWDPRLVDLFVEMVRGDLEARHEVADDMFGESP